MNPDTTVYTLMPMSEEPVEKGWYILVGAFPEYPYSQAMKFENGEWVALPRTPLKGWLKPANQPSHISVDDLCKQLEEANEWAPCVPSYNAFNEAVDRLREILQGKIINTPQAISDLWDACCKWHEYKINSRYDESWKEIVEDYKGETPQPDKATYLKEHFGIEKESL